MAYCRTCEKEFHKLGISRHRAMHRDKFEDCVIEYLYRTIRHNYSERRSRDAIPLPVAMKGKWVMLWELE